MHNDPHSTQALPHVPAGGAEFQPQAPGTEYSAHGAVQSNTVTHGMSELPYVISLSIAKENRNDSRRASQKPPPCPTMATIQSRRVSLPSRSSARAHMRTALSTRAALRLYPLFTRAGPSSSLWCPIWDTAHVHQPLCHTHTTILLRRRAP